MWEQYDHQVMADTAIGPGSDAAVVRVHGTDKALAFTADVTPRYCKANPFEGGKQAVAEAYRNLSATGARPLASTDNLNFGNPEKPEIMGQFVGCVKGIGAACAALDMPIVSGNVSLYNETDGAAIPPTPTIGGVGLAPHGRHPTPMAFQAEGSEIWLVGETKGHLGQSALLKELWDREDGDAPTVDLEAEARNGTFVRRAPENGLISACHDLSDGGLAMGLAEMAIASGIGATVEWDAALSAAKWFFGEDQARYLVEVPVGRAEALRTAAEAAGVPARRIGVTGGDSLSLGAAAAPVSKLKAAYEGGFRAMMGEEA